MVRSTMLEKVFDDALAEFRLSNFFDAFCVLPFFDRKYTDGALHDRGRAGRAGGGGQGRLGRRSAEQWSGAKDH